MNIGLIGGGQLGLMMIEAAHKLKHKVTVLDSEQNCPASKICDDLVVGDYSDKDKLKLWDKIEIIVIVVLLKELNKHVS